LDFREYAASASRATGRLRVGAQVIGQPLGDGGTDKRGLDRATLDGQPCVGGSTAELVASEAGAVNRSPRRSRPQPPTRRPR
jgi:hypothetical protein